MSLSLRQQLAVLLACEDNAVAICGIAVWLENEVGCARMDYVSELREMTVSDGCAVETVGLPQSQTLFEQIVVVGRDEAARA